MLSLLLKCGAVISGAAACYSYATKPDDASFARFLENFIKQPMAKNILASLGTKIVIKLADIQYKDYVFFRTATVGFPDGTELTFVGMVQSWHLVDSSK